MNVIIKLNQENRQYINHKKLLNVTKLWRFQNGKNIRLFNDKELGRIPESSVIQKDRKIGWEFYQGQK